MDWNNQILLNHDPTDYVFQTGNYTNAALHFNSAWSLHSFQITWTKKNPLATLGVLAPGFTHARPFALPPIDISRNSLAHMWGGGGVVNLSN